MLIQTVETNRRIQRKIYYKSANKSQNHQISHPSEQYKPNFLQKPIIQPQISKRLQSYKFLQDNKQNQINQKDMSRSNIAKLNQQIEERTKYFTNRGKYSSKWAEDRYDNFLSTSRSSQRNSSPPRSTTSSVYPNSSNIRLTNQYNQKTPLNNYSYNIPHNIPQQNMKIPRVTFADQYPTNSYIAKNSQYNQYSQPKYMRNSYQQRNDEFYDLSNPSDALKYHTNQAKDAVKQEAHQVKQEVKQNVKNNVKNAVGVQNYQLMRDIKDSAGQIKDNVKQGAKDLAYQVAQPAIIAKDIVAEGAKQVKQNVKEGVKDTTKAVVGPQNFQLMKYITDAISQIKTNVFGKSPPKVQVKPQNQYASKNNLRSGNITSTVIRSESLDEVSPIVYSQRSFSKSPGDQLTFFWIYGLIAIGFFLVIFQAIK